jgi:predicted ArsR family transcriptional regulator
VRGLDTLVRLADKLSTTGATPVVDAETAGRLLSVTPRTARRLLATLVDEGLAWPLPPSRSPQPGRPRQAYRLVIEKLGPPRVR